MNFPIFFLLALVTCVICDDAHAPEVNLGDLSSKPDLLKIASALKGLISKLDLSEEELSKITKGVKTYMAEGKVDQEAVRETLSMFEKKAKNFLQRANDEDIEKLKTGIMENLAPVFKSFSGNLEQEDKEALQKLKRVFKAYSEGGKVDNKDAEEIKVYVGKKLKNLLEKAGIENVKALKDTLQKSFKEFKGKDKVESIEEMKARKSKLGEFFKNKIDSKVSEKDLKGRKSKLGEMFKNKFNAKNRENDETQRKNKQGELNKNKKDDSKDWTRLYSYVKQRENARENARGYNAERRQGGPMNKRGNKNMKRGNKNKMPGNKNKMPGNKNKMPGNKQRRGQKQNMNSVGGSQFNRPNQNQSPMRFA